MKHIPERSCIVCRRKADKSELIRIVRKPDGEFVLDPTGKEAGRGAYICRTGSCVADAAKKRALNRAYKTEVDKSVYDALLAAYNELTNG